MVNTRPSRPTAAAPSSITLVDDSHSSASNTNHQARHVEKPTLAELRKSTTVISTSSSQRANISPKCLCKRTQPKLKHAPSIRDDETTFSAYQQHHVSVLPPYLSTHASAPNLCRSLHPLFRTTRLSLPPPLLPYQRRHLRAPTPHPHSRSNHPPNPSAPSPLQNPQLYPLFQCLGAHIHKPP